MFQIQGLHVDKFGLMYISIILLGSAADLCKSAMIQLDKNISQTNLRSHIIVQIHDEIILEVHDDDLVDVKSKCK